MQRSVIPPAIMLTILALLLLLTASCKKRVDYDGIVKENLPTDRAGLEELLSDLKIEQPEMISFNDSNYYFLVAASYYEVHGSDRYFNYFIRQALKEEDTLFRREALELYLKSLIKRGELKEVKRVAALYSDELDSEYGPVYKAFAGGEGSPKPETLPADIDLLALLATPFIKELDLGVVRRYFSSIYNESELKERRALVKRAAELTKSSYISAIYHHLEGDKTVLASTLKSAMLECEELRELSVLHKLAEKNKLRRELYGHLKSEVETRPLYKYYYAIESVYYLGNKRALKIVKDTLPLYDRICLENYYLRSKVLYLEKSYSESWIKGVLQFNNDYPGYYHSRMLLNSLLRSALVGNNIKLLNSNLSLLEEEKMAELNRSIYYYIMTLADGKNSQWKERLTEKHPLSYGALRLVRGELDDTPAEPLLDYRKRAISEEGSPLLQKVDYLLEFGLYERARGLKIEELNSVEDRAIIYYTLHNYLLEKGRYKEGVAMGNSLAFALYDKNLQGVDLVTLKTIFPLHYRSIIEKYSALYGVDPALAFAVMREESFFQESVKSWAGAVGLMQVMPATADWLAPKVKMKEIDLTNPDHNIRLGVYFLDFLTRYFTEPELIMAGYNAGQGNALKWMRRYKGYSPEVMYELIPVDETRHYIRKVTRSYYIYKYILAQERAAK